MPRTQGLCLKTDMLPHRSTLSRRPPIATQSLLRRKARRRDFFTPYRNITSSRHCSSSSTSTTTGRLSSSPPPEDSATISRAPVRYTQNTQNQEDEDEDMDDRPGLGSSNEPQDDGPRSSRPGQAGFAHRLMSKYGWTRGTGLGADESGIVNPLQVQVEKRRKKADADGGGWAEPGGKGKIIGGKRKEESSKFGAMSEVIVLQDMLENITDLQAEIADGLAQEIGEECGEKYGRVERLYIDQSSRQVFIKFTNQVSALRAVDALAGRVFNGNTIKPKFFDVEKFEKGIYQ
uniref:G-patch domain-containing protein n=1 Tax=Bionectria ochroleuca TaxID=29856 RepID=A0A8H7NG19_BIOOC